MYGRLSSICNIIIQSCWMESQLWIKIVQDYSIIELVTRAPILFDCAFHPLSSFSMQDIIIAPIHKSLLLLSQVWIKKLVLRLLQLLIVRTRLTLPCYGQVFFSLS